MKTNKIIAIVVISLVLTISGYNVIQYLNNYGSHPTEVIKKTEETQIQIPSAKNDNAPLLGIWLGFNLFFAIGLGILYLIYTFSDKTDIFGHPQTYFQYAIWDDDFPGSIVSFLGLIVNGIALLIATVTFTVKIFN